MNIFALTKAEKKSRLKFRCVHRHNGINHHRCYDQANNINERIGFIDIESSQLNASFGIMLSVCILSDEKELFKRVISPEELRSGVFDRALCEELCEEMRKYDRLIGYYSEKFDIPFIRTRCIYHDLDFPMYHEIKHTDLWRIVRKKLKIHSNRLSAVAPFFGIKAKDHPLTPSVWINALSGNKDALDFILTHNVEDVYSTRELYHKLDNHHKLSGTSI
jgi:uncharacterized protein YprB with RNaseH-like and TPR domain